MKKYNYFSLLLLGLSTLAYSQVGVNTNEPKEILDVKGTTRVQELPDDNGKIYNGAATAETDYTATKFVVANDDGVLGSKPLNYINQMVAIKGTNVDIDDIPNKTLSTESRGRQGKSQSKTEEVATHTFTLKEKSVVYVIVGLSVQSILNKQGKYIKDGQIRRFAMFVRLKEGDGPKKTIISNSSFYTQGETETLTETNDNGDTVDTPTVIGTAYLNGSRVLVLPAGTYTVSVDGSLFTETENGITAVFGGQSSDFINVITNPINNENALPN